jgi:ferric-dicitrate binding protein FerR (iron transport regulator)
MKEEEKIVEIISKKLNGNISTEESAELQEWLAMPGNSELYSQYERIWKHTESVWTKQENFVPNTASSWELIEDQIEIEQPKQRFKWAYGIAATLALLLAVVGITYFFNMSSNAQNIELVLDANENDTITFSDGSLAYLFGPCSISYQKDFNDDERNIQMDGFAYFDIAHEAYRPFKVTTDRGTIDVLGTSFTVDTRQAAIFEVQCLTGKVKVTTSQTTEPAQTILTRNKKSIYSSQSNDLQVSTFDIADVGFFVPSRDMSFNNQPLGDILERIEYNYDVSIQLENKDLLQSKYSTTLNDSTLDDFLNELKVTFKVEVIQSNSSSYILKGGNLN